MMIRDKLYSVRNQILFLLPQFDNIYVKTFNLIPIQIDKAQSAGDKFISFVDRTISNITLDDLKYVTTIGQSAFRNCTSLASVVIPDSVTIIGDWAFNNCSSLTDIYLRSTTPPTLGDVYAIPETTTIHVPVGSGAAYKSATNWSYHSSRIVEDIVIE